MPQPIGFTGFSRCLYINFLSANGIIEVPPTITLTNGLGIIGHITFLDDGFKASHPEMIVAKKSDSPDEDKSIGDAVSLKPVLSDFFSLHPGFHPDVFLGDSSFDTIETYRMLLGDFHFSRALIPYNPRNESSLKKVGYNEYGYPTCPNAPSLDMKYCGVTHEKGHADRIKWICPKVHMVKGKYVCDCKIPAPPPPKDVPLIHTKIWISACSPEFKGIPFTKPGQLWNVPLTT